MATSKRKAGAAFARIRKICLALPDTTEKLAWGEETFRVRERLFVMCANNHHNDGRVAIWCNAPEGVQRALVDSDPEHYFVPPYVGPGGWLGVRLDTGLPWPAISALIEQAWRTTAAKAAGNSRRKRTQAATGGRPQRS